MITGYIDISCCISKNTQSSLARHKQNLKQRFLMHSKPRGRPVSNQAPRRSFDKSLTASEEDILLQMMIKEARVREERQLRKQWQKFGIVKIEQPWPCVKIEESDGQSFSDYQEKNKRIENKQKHIGIRKGILNIKIKGKSRKRVKKTSAERSDGLFSNQSTLDRYITNKIFNAHKGNSKVNTSLSSSQTTLDSYFMIKMVHKQE